MRRHDKMVKLAHADHHPLVVNEGSLEGLPMLAPNALVASAPENRNDFLFSTSPFKARISRLTSSCAESPEILAPPNIVEDNEVEEIIPREYV